MFLSLNKWRSINKLILLVLLMKAQAAFAQKVFTIDDFSKPYYGKVKIADCDSSGYCNGAGNVWIYDRQSGKALISVAVEQLALWLHKGKVKANIRELPYGEQSIIIHDDFNFDGIKDFAIQDGQNSCYSGPSFKIFLAQGNGFKYNKDFTALAQEYCGMFQVNAKAKQISTMTKSGCCWHQYSEFIVEHNKPKAVHIVEEDMMSYPYGTYTKKVWQDGKWETTNNRMVDLKADGLKQVLSFSLEQGGKTVVLFNMEGNLHYVLLRQKEEVELAFPLDAADEKPVFTFDSTPGRQTLTFSNKQAQYKIYEYTGTSAGIGITVMVNGKNYEMPGILSSKEGSLQELQKAKPENVVLK